MRLLFCVFLAIFSITLPLSSSFAKSDARKPSLNRLILLNEFNSARNLLARLPHGRHDEFFLEAQIAKRQGKLTKAARFYRLALSVKPTFLLAKRELAHTLYLQGNFEGAKLHFESLSANARSESERQGYQQFIDAATSDRNYGMSAYIGILPSSNFNRGSNRKVYRTGFGTFSLSNSARRKSSIGLGAGVSAYYKYSLSNKNAFLFSGSVGSNLYKQREFTRVNTAGNIELLHKFQSGRVLVGATIRTIVKDWERSGFQYGLTLRGSHKLNARNRLSFNASAIKQEFNNSKYLNGYHYAASVSLNRLLSSTARLFMEAGADHETTKRAYLDYSAFNLTIGLEKQWVGGFLSSHFVRFENSFYKKNFTGLSKKRRDHILTLGGTVLNSNISIQGFTPKLRYTYTYHKSNIAFYDYDAHDFGLVFTRKF